jgi:hypothetical protein
VALITAVSPSFKKGESARKIVKLEAIVTIPDPAFTIVGLKVPVNVASIGTGFVPPIGLAVPLKDSPSGASVKYVPGG